ncbi:TFC4 [[Candida] subhashii]|uniref:TFC4 n=1 Tax=[Candida] subhashii TaxID=561895 RepID=A0A8J5UPG9_9ASCO|nr:TFC4 [[Candida] subhashii]KAG7664201.1 TFC4 [[Candida] subhashii]
MSNNVFETEEGKGVVNEANSLQSINGANQLEDEDQQFDELLNEFQNEAEQDDDNEFEDQQLVFDQSDDDDDDFIFGDESEEDDYDENYNFKDALKSAGNFRVRNRREKLSTSAKSYYKRKMMRADNRELDPEVRSNLSKANEAFVRNDIQVAQNLYLEVIKKDPKNFSAYKTLGEIYKQQGKLNECCNYWLLAANIHPWDTQFWGNVAELSAELGHVDQAIYCYGRAITSDVKKSARYILQRALLYKERRQFGKALDGLQKVRILYPADSNIIKQLASVYVEQKRLNDAINLYMKVLDSNIHPDPDNKTSYPAFGWAELNILLELHIQHHSWRIGLNVLKLASRWIQNRTNETFWDENDDDAEYDKERRPAILAKVKDAGLRREAESKFFDLPIDIRFKLGSLRLGLGQKEEAIHHFDFLLEDEEDIADLHFDAGKALEEHGYHEEALTFLTRATLNDEFNESPELINLLGKCFFEVGDYSQAKQAYETLLENEPTNLDFKLALAETLYHLGDDEKAQILIKEVQTANNMSKERKGDQVEDIFEEDEEETNNLSLIKTQIRLRPKSAKLTEQERSEIENLATRKVLEKFGRMERLEESINSGDKTAVAAWMQLAAPLIEMFTSVKNFFPKDKNREFKGIVLYRRKKGMNIDERLARAYNLLEGITQDENYSRHTLTAKTEYRGLTYDQWFYIFAQYAILVSKFEKNNEYANEIVDIAMAGSVFIQDKKKEAFLKLLKLMIGIENDEHNTTVVSYIRYFLVTNQFSPFVCRLFFCCFSSGVYPWETFTSYNHQKFFLRQLKAYDSCALKKKITGMAMVTADVKNVKLTKDHPDLLYLYANLLGGSRSYSSSLVYLNRAYKRYNQDPMICLVMGLLHVHRAMQRLSSNRHIQLLQGISYILEYRDIRAKGATKYELQEIEYNLARLFHMLGLTSLAVPHYDKVLAMHDEFIDDPDYDLSFDAAYNLSLIYNISGNSQYARELTERYLTV